LLKIKNFLIFLSFVALLFTINQAAFSAEKKTSSELTRLMVDIDRSYKKSEAISGYYDYSDEEWDILYDSGSVVSRLTKQVQAKYGRPDNKKYEDLMEAMRVAAQKMADIANKKRGEDGALEDVQWQVRKLRNSCAECHRLLNIHIYPNLYPKKKHRREEGIFKDWGKPD